MSPCPGSVGVRVLAERCGVAVGIAVRLGEYHAAVPAAVLCSRHLTNHVLVSQGDPSSRIGRRGRSDIRRNAVLVTCFTTSGMARRHAPGINDQDGSTPTTGADPADSRSPEDTPSHQPRRTRPLLRESQGFVLRPKPNGASYWPTSTIVLTATDRAVGLTSQAGSPVRSAARPHDTRGAPPRPPVPGVRSLSLTTASRPEPRGDGARHTLPADSDDACSSASRRSVTHAAIRDRELKPSLRRMFST